ncbi:hypothetical protein FH972_009585 [Carpinus fangiana]|uniref:LOB domain-containing protein n=1 Tax=Carpinus fangiana TaxID=176857 RepID=A0A660KMD2_9ROSI|nr:hypothetical protein FH972_009585 [Carpinus fangiana]
MIGEVEKVDRDKTMECIIYDYEANVRCAYPVEGCCGILRMLHRSIHAISRSISEAELIITRHQIAILRAHQMPAVNQ